MTDQKVVDVKSDNKIQPLIVGLVKCEDIHQKLSDEFPQIFKSVRIYGSSAEPLFIAKDVQDMLGLKAMRFDRDFEPGTERVLIQIPTIGGLQNLVALTEQGLYRLLFKSKTDIGSKFRRFVVIVLRDLRTKGVATLEESIRKLTAQHEESLRKLNGQLEEEHTEVLKQRQASEMYYMQAKDYQMAAESKEQKNKALERSLKADGQHALLDKLKEKYMKKYYIVLGKTPKELEGEFDNDDDPTNDEERVFSLVSKPPDDGECGCVYVHKDMKTADMHAYLCEHGFGIKVPDKQEHYKNKYRATIDQLIEIFDEMAEKG